MSTPFSHQPDPELGKALRQLLSADEDDTFVERVLARAAEFRGKLPSGGPWWEVLGTWARPGLAAAAVGLLVAGGIWSAGGRGPAAETALGDPLAGPAGDSVHAAFLAQARPPDLDLVLAASLPESNGR